jgi:hypothetical protein
VFPVRYKLDSYILFRRNPVFKGRYIDLDMSSAGDGLPLTFPGCYSWEMTLNVGGLDVPLDNM